MVFRKINYGSKKIEIRKLLRGRQDLKRRVSYHKNKISMHEEKIKEIENKSIVDVEAKINKYLARAQK